MMLNEFAKQLIKNFPLGFIATVTEDGLPSLSPKGTFIVLDDETIAFAEIRSPNTMKNLRHQPEVEVNFMDIWLRKGIRIRGKTEVIERGCETFDNMINIWATPYPTLAPRINSIVTINTDRVKLLTTPPYDDGATEEEMVALYKKKFAEIYP